MSGLGSRFVVSGIVGFGRTRFRIASSMASRIISACERRSTFAAFSSCRFKRSGSVTVVLVIRASQRPPQRPQFLPEPRRIVAVLVLHVGEHGVQRLGHGTLEQRRVGAGEGGGERL